MVKNRYLFLFLVLLILVIKYDLNSFLKEPILKITNGIKEHYIDLIDEISNIINKHIAQEKSIERLEKEVRKLKKSALLSSAFASKLRSLLKDENGTYNPDIKLTRAISYVNLANYNRVWLDFKNPKKGKIYGLLFEGYSAGIAINKDKKTLGILQGDEKCIYSVYIGKDRVPGVIFGNKDSMIVKYIPLWRKLKIGDEVYTSGLDNIFFEGIKVGKVFKIVKEESYKSALVKPYSKILVPGYFHIITTP